MPRIAKRGPCKIEGCDRPELSLGFCGSHYMRLRDHGDPLAGGPQKRYSPKICEIDGCGEVVAGQGLCRGHLFRKRKHGNPLMSSGYGSAPEIFVEKIVQTYDGKDCLIWPFTRTPQGYARYRGKAICRAICEEQNGPPPTPEHHAAHTCGNGSGGCCSRWHLRWATPLENNLDRALHGTLPVGERVYSAKLSAEQVLEIRSRPDESIVKLAKEYNVSKSTIYEIRIGRTWKSVWAPIGSAKENRNAA